MNPRGSDINGVHWALDSELEYSDVEVECIQDFQTHGVLRVPLLEPQGVGGYPLPYPPGGAPIVLRATRKLG